MIAAIASLWLRVRGPLQSFVVSKALSFQDILVFAVASDFSGGKIRNFHTFFGDVFSSAFWFGIFVSVFFGIGPFYRIGQKLRADAPCPNCGGTPAPAGKV